MAKMYYENDANLDLIRGKTIGIIGFGSQGHAHALNLRDSGCNVHFNQIVPPDDVDVTMIAPKAPGHRMREMFEQGVGVPALIAVHQNATENAQQVALAYGKGIGCAKAGIIETTFAEETETDLFGEQTVLCGGVTALVKTAFETLVQAGYQPEIAYFECMHELKLLVDLMHEGGMAYMRYSISDTAEYGDYTRGPRVIDDHVRQQMKQVLNNIRSGAFAREWIIENQAGRPSFYALRRQNQEHMIEKVGAELRSMMPWLKKREAAPATAPAPAPTAAPADGGRSQASPTASFAPPVEPYQPPEDAVTPPRESSSSAYPPYRPSTS